MGDDKEVESLPSRTNVGKIYLFIFTKTESHSSKNLLSAAAGMSSAFVLRQSHECFSRKCRELKLFASILQFFFFNRLTLSCCARSD